MLSFVKLLPALTPATIAAAITGIAGLAAKAGVTYIHEPATGAVAGVKEVDLLHQAFGRPGFPVRGSMSLWGLNLDDFIAAGIVPGSGDDRLRAQTVKWVSDGSNQGYTGFLRQNYLGRDTRGAANFTQQELDANFAKTVAAQWPIMCHANGDAAMDMVMSAFASAAALPEWDPAKRHRTEHSSLLRDEHIAAMAKLGITPSFLMNHVRLWGRVMRDDILGAERADLLDRYGSAVRAGLRASFHCDFSVSPIGPLNYIATAAARTLADGGDVLNPAERVPVAQALKGSTIDAAWMCHADGLVGSLATGKAADFVLLGGDPLAYEADPDAVREIDVLATYLDGQAMYSA
jgi:predicted amidohydrolase YtcJ